MNIKIKGISMPTVKGKTKHYIVLGEESNNEILTVSEQQYQRIIKLIENAKHGNTLDKQHQMG